MNVRKLTLQELSKGNKRLCLTADRALGKCHLCKMYPANARRGRYKKCESVINNPKYNILILERDKEMREHYEKIRNINTRIDRL